MTEPAIPTIIRAHQYLYYVLGTPVISDHEYDLLCKKHGVFGGGGSDRAQDYDEDAVKMAMRLLRHD